MRSTHRVPAPVPTVALDQAGYQLMFSRHYAEAIAAFEAVTLDKPDAFEAWECLGFCHVQLRQFVDGERCYRMAMQLQDHPLLSTVCGLAEALAFETKYDDAKAVLKAIAHEPRDRQAEAWYQACYGNVSALAFDLDSARVAYATSIERNPNVWVVWTSLGHVRTELKDWDKARDCYDNAYRLEKNMQTAHALGEVRMRDGRYEEGWRLWETRIGEPKLQHRDRKTPRWDGGACECLCIWHEGGVGDATMFSRYLPLVAPRVKSAKVAVPAHLCEYLKGFELPANMEVVERIQIGSYDAQAAFMSLPLLTGRFAPADAPPPLRFLNPPPVMNRLDRPFTVVLNWGGADIHPNDSVRSTDLEQWAALVRSNPNLVWWNLSPEETAAEDIRRCNLPILRRTGTLSQSAAKLMEADLVITVDSGQAHIAATLGVPTWTLLTYSPEWRWPVDGDTTPLYSTMKLYRQARPRDWSDVIARIRNDLAEKLNGR